MSGTIRPKVRDDDGSIETLVHEYADREGLRTSRAWADLVEAGLQSEDLGSLDAIQDGDQR